MREVWIICDNDRPRMWTVACGDPESLESVDSLPTKREALSLARELCHADKPSQMIVQRMDGTVGQRHRYTP